MTTPDEASACKHTDDEKKERVRWEGRCPLCLYEEKDALRTALATAVGLLIGYGHGEAAVDLREVMERGGRKKL